MEPLTGSLAAVLMMRLMLAMSGRLGVVGRAVRSVDPPPVLAKDGAGRDAGNKMGAGDGRSGRCADAHPVALFDVARGGNLGRHLQTWMRRETAQRRDVAVLAVAVGDRLGATETQGKCLRRCRHVGRCEGWDGRISVLLQALGVDFDSLRRRGKAALIAVGVALRMSLERHGGGDLDTFRLGSELGDRKPAWRKQRVVSPICIAAEELLL